MKTDPCIVCSIIKGKRVCKLNDNGLICPVCCAKTRIPECDGCAYYTQAAHYARGKAENEIPKKFIARIDPEVDEIVDQAMAMVEKGKVGAAEKIIAGLLIKHPDLHTVQYAMGVICGMKENYDAAIKYFDRAIKIFPYFVEAWFNKATSHQKKFEVREMVYAFQKVIDLGDPKDDFVRHAKNFLFSFAKNIQSESGLSLDAYLQLSEKYESTFSIMEKQQFEKALLGFKEIVAIHPKHTQSWGNMGLCYAFLGQQDEAIAAFDKALEIDPGYEPAIVNRQNVMSLPKGQKLASPNFKSIDYYKDYPIKTKSLISKLFK